jgi:peptidyl-dipeptidase A
MEIKEIELFLKEKEKEIATLYKNLSLANWRATISGKKEDYEEYAKNELILKKFFNNKEDFEKIKKMSKVKIKDETISRELKLFYYAYLSYQGDYRLMEEITRKVTGAEQKFNTFRAKINGKEYTENEIKEILKKGKDNNKSRAIWESEKIKAELIEKDMLDIVRLRNKLAVSLGFRDYYEFSLEVGEQKEKEMEKIMDRLDKLTKAPFQKLKEEMDSVLSKKYNIRKEELGPWNYGDAFFQEGPEIYEIELDKYYKEDIVEKVKKYYASIGLDVTGLINRSDLYEKPGKDQHAFCIDIDRKGDVRTLQNLKNTEQWMDTILHEFGHGIYSENHDKTDLPFILKDSAHIFTTEAIAMLFGRKARNAQFIKNYCGIDDKEKEKIKATVKKMLRLRMLVFSRWVQVMVRFEQQLYKDPEQDLNKLWWDLVKKYQLVDFSRDKPDWASKYHILAAPVYYHNYLLGELLASQIHDYITKKITKEPDSDYSNNKEVGKYLIDNIFSPGAKYRWDEMIKRALGEELNPKYFVEEFAK